MLQVGEGARAPEQEEGKRLSRFLRPGASPAQPSPAEEARDMPPPPWQQADG